MADTLGWRLKLGVLVSSTNTAVQPEYDAMRPPGVTNHVRAFRIPNAPTRTDAEFERQLGNMRATMVDARALARARLLALKPGGGKLRPGQGRAGGGGGLRIGGRLPVAFATLHGRVEQPRVLRTATAPSRREPDRRRARSDHQCPVHGAIPTSLWRYGQAGADLPRRPRPPFGSPTLPRRRRPPCPR